MNYQIFAIVPTSYQYASLSHFGATIHKHANGSYSISEQFESIDNARAHLITRAEIYNDLDPEGNLDKLKSMVHSIMNNDCLTLDACTAYIQPIEDISTDD